MMRYLFDMYRKPEQYGLTQVARLENNDDYGFDIVVAWYDGSQFYVARDFSSWSHTPFDDHWDYGSMEVAEVPTAEGALTLMRDLAGQSRVPLSGDALEQFAKLEQLLANADATYASMRLKVAEPAI